MSTSDDFPKPDRPVRQAGRDTRFAALRRWWDAFNAAGRERGLHALAMQIRRAGGHVSGDLATDARQLARCRGFQAD